MDAPPVSSTLTKHIDTLRQVLIVWLTTSNPVTTQEQLRWRSQQRPPMLGRTGAQRRKGRSRTVLA
jgi:hypothetical protein